MEMRRILKSSLDHGFRNAPVRWLMLGGLFAGGVGIYAFYAMQPYLLELYGKKESYAIAGLAASIVAGTQIIGGIIVPHVARIFRRRTSLLFVGSVSEHGRPGAHRSGPEFLGRARPSGRLGHGLRRHDARSRGLHQRSHPVGGARHGPLDRQPHRARRGASFSNRGWARWPTSGGTPSSYVVGAGLELLSVPFILLARREKASSDPIRKS